MIRFIHNGNLTKPEVRQHIKLIITGSREDGYRWIYSSNFIHLGPRETKVAIEIVNEALGIDSASIVDYCSTGVTESYTPIKKFTLATPEKPAVLTIRVPAKQLIDFAVFVDLKIGGEVVATLFCDPQASNDPDPT
ncbi:MAG: hypothetical protein M3Q42_03660 [Pseudomonadota bacterium]|nr:hypothetical protein [Pseudomonadota bacterium]